MIRITFNRREYMKVKDAIANIDPDAFVTFTQTILVGGEGFTKLKSRKEDNTISNIKKVIDKNKNEEQ